MVEVRNIGVLQRFLWGLTGGAASIAAKIYGEGAIGIAEIVRNAEYAEMIGYCAVACALLFLGAVVGSAVRSENNPIKLIAIAAAAPALITTWSTGGSHTESSIPTLQRAPVAVVSAARVIDFLIAPGFAQDPVMESTQPVLTDASDGTSEKQNISLEGIRRGVGLFFGKTEKKYWVIVGSHRELSAAEAQAEEINMEDASLEAWVGVKVPPNDFYPVIVGQYSEIKTARALEQRARRALAIDDAYLSVGARR